MVDLSLAAGNVVGLLKSIRQRAPATKVVLLTVHDEPTVATAALAAGADGVVLTRAIATDLLPAVDAIFAGQSYSLRGLHPLTSATKPTQRRAG